MISQPQDIRKLVKAKVYQSNESKTHNEDKDKRLTACDELLTRGSAVSTVSTFLRTLFEFSSSSDTSSDIFLSNQGFVTVTSASFRPRLFSALHENFPRASESHLEIWRTWRLSRLQMVTPSVAWSRRPSLIQSTLGSEDEWTTHWSSRPH